jgi:hypothetical protein
MQGFIPMAVDLLNAPLAAVFDGRSVFLIDDERGAGLRVLVDVALRSQRPHVLIQTSTEDEHGLPNIRLPRLAGAERMRFNVRRRTVPVISRAAEHAPVYGAAAPASPIPWPVPGEVVALRRQIEDGMRCLDEGRHAPGERDLRQAIGALTRRGEWAGAAEGSLALGASLLKRGRPRDAKAVIDAARESCRSGIWVRRSVHLTRSRFCRVLKPSRCAWIESARTLLRSPTF